MNPWHAVIAMAALACILPSAARAQQLDTRDRTCFQEGGGYIPEVDIASDVAIVYGVGGDFAERAAKWRDKGYHVSLMTGIAWGGYNAYFGTGDSFKKDEVQTRKNGSLFMHGGDIGYNVPTDGYIDFMKKYIEPAVDAGVQAVYLEEPEYWAQTGWSEAFKREWQRFYGEPWQEPDSSVDAQYRTSKLKYELYFKALREVFTHVDERAAAKGISVECHVPTHSLINYAQWRIVSPESHLIDIPALDGYIAQVWTGTARCANTYNGKTKERTFEGAYLEYGQMLGMVRPTGKKVWFLADPVEDNPNRSWNDYKVNYECTVIASLMWPEVSRFEVMPWPSRIFNGTYPQADMDAKSGNRVGIPPTYATQILTVINALNEMDQTDIEYDSGTRGIGVLVSDTLMFQRAAPEESEPHLDNFYGLALPLVKHGVPVEIVQLENTPHPECLKPYKVLFLTYEGQKPLKPDYHEALDRWVRQGGGLVFVDESTDPYNTVREWWNDQGKTAAKPCDDLFKRLGITDKARREPEAVGKGFVRIYPVNPSALPNREDGADAVMGLASEMLRALNLDIATKNYLRVRRGPFVIASVLDESVSDEPLRLRGAFVDMFAASLPVIKECELKPGERTLLADLDWFKRQGIQAKVVAAGARVKSESIEKNGFTFTVRGPKATQGIARVLLPKRPTRAVALPDTPLDPAWDETSGTALLSFDNVADDVTIRVEW